MAEKTLKLGVCILLVVLFIAQLPAQVVELGNYPVKNFSPDDYNSLPQIWSVVQDNRGIMYFGNRDGVLQFDGKNWKKISVGNDLIARSLCLGTDGKIYVGSENEIGFIDADKNGKTRYNSLMYLIDSSKNKFGDIWNVWAYNNKVVFQSSSDLFVLFEKKIIVIHSQTEIINSFLIGHTLFVLTIDQGLYVLENKNLKLIENTQQLSADELYVLLPIKYNIYLGATNKTGICKLNYLKDKNIMKVIPIKTSINSFLKAKQIYSGAKVDDSTYAIGTFNGIKVIDAKGNYKYVLNKSTGLFDENIKYQFIDNNKNWWLGLSNGISMVQVGSPITYFDDKRGVPATVEWIGRYNSKLVLATSIGALTNQHAIDKLAFEQLKGIKASETWITQTFNVNGSKILLIEQNDKIYAIEGSEISTVYQGIPWAIYQDKFEDTKFYIGEEDGVHLISKNNDIWIETGKLEGVKDRITNIYITEDHTLWLSAEVKGIYRSVNSAYNSFKFFGDSLGLPGGPYIFEYYNNDLLFGTKNGIYKYQKNKDTIIYDNQFFKKEPGKSYYIHRLSKDFDNNLWAVVYYEHEQREEVGYFYYNADSVLVWNPTPFLGNIKGQINAIYHEKNGITWLGGSEGLFRYNADVDENYKQNFNCLIRQVRLGVDSTYFFGDYFDRNKVFSTKQPESLKPILDYEYNSLIFDYAAMNIDIDHPTNYSYFLVGYDKKWSDWSTETKKEYTNLYEGTYNFKVKAKNVYNCESSTATFQFEILPPWYRTWWAYLLMCLAAIAIVYFIVKQYTRYLRAVIRENTAEIRAQKDEIEKQKDEITASIKYAERIQRAVVPTAERARELLPEHFIMWRPRDIVSGDFWWMAEKNGKVAIIAADCTGHGVPGAFMSMLGIAFLNEIVAINGITQANLILNELRTQVKTTLKQTGKEGESKDGMDLALVVIDQDRKKIQYAGAYNPLFLIRNGKLIETKADRNPIGIYIKELSSFTNHEINIQNGDTIYTFSDGFVDQFGGKKGSKFKTKNFKNLLLQIQDKTMAEQHDILYREVDNWRGDFEQVDDIIVVGIRF